MKPKKPSPLEKVGLTREEVIAILNRPPPEAPPKPVRPPCPVCGKPIGPKNCQPLILNS